MKRGNWFSHLNIHKQVRKLQEWRVAGLRKTGRNREKFDALGQSETS
jgi:hypothetical protein